MKFLEYTPLARMSSFLSHISLGDHVIQGVLEAYSCKVAGVDKKLSRSLEQEVVDSLAFSPQELAASPVGPLSSSSSRKTLVYLILTLNHVYPDYDFSMLRSHHFAKEGGLQPISASIDQHLADAAKAWEAEMGGDDAAFGDALWAAIDEVIQLADCEVYSYAPDDSVDMFPHQGCCIWSFFYFFYNRKLKRILYFSCIARSSSSSSKKAQKKLPGREGNSNSEDDEDDDTDYVDMADSMDLED